MSISIKKEIDDLLRKDMDRRGFLKHVAIGFAGLVGLSAIVKHLNGLDQPNKSPQSFGYGSSVYGGQTRQRQDQRT